MNAFVASHEQDADLRRLCREIPIDGAVTVAYEREPDFFQGLGVMGAENQAIAVEADGAIIGVGCRSTADYWVNGEVRPFGYLSGLRSAVRMAATGLIRGFECLRQLHDDHPVDGYFTTIIENNRRAMKVLTSGSRHPALPRYVDLGAYYTHAIILNRFRHRSGAANLDVTTGDAFPLEELVEFINLQGARRQFHPHWTADDFGSPRLLGLAPGDLLVATRNARIVGLVAVWDQRAYKQHRVVKYGTGLKFLRSGLDLAARVVGYAGLPKPGDCISTVHLAMISVVDDDPAVLTELIAMACRQASKKGVHFLTIGVHADDPLSQAVDPFGGIRYDSRLFAVDWAGEAVIRGRFDGRVPYLEPAIL